MSNFALSSARDGDTFLIATKGVTALAEGNEHDGERFREAGIIVVIWRCSHSRDGLRDWSGNGGRPGRPAGKPETVSANANFSATANAASGGVHIDSVSAGAKVTFSAESNVKYTCIIETKKHRKLVGYCR